MGYNTLVAGMRKAVLQQALQMVRNRKVHVIGGHGAFTFVGKDKDICAECHRPVNYSKIKHLFEMYVKAR